MTSAATLVIVLAVTLALTQRAAQGAAATSIASGLTSAQGSVMQSLRRESGVLAGRLRAYADNPGYRSSIESKDGDFLDYTQVAAEQTGADWVQLVSREGVRLAKSDDPSAPPDTLLGSQLIAGALNGQVKDGFGVARDSVLIQLVAVPVEGAGRRIIGALMGARPVSDSLARGAGTQTQSQLLFYTLDRDGEPRAAAGSDDARAMSADLVEVIKAHVDSSSGGDADTVGVTDEIDFNGGKYVSRRKTLFSANGLPVGGFLTVRSLDKQLRDSGFTNLRNTLLLSGALGLVVARHVKLFYWYANRFKKLSLLPTA